jgi:hypothetical protein
MSHLSEIIATLLPAWMMGFMVVTMTILAGYKDLFRVDVKSVIKWCGFLGLSAIYRFILLKYFPNFQPVKVNLGDIVWIPWQTTLMVWWEDACHILPLILLFKLIGKRWFTWPIHFVAISMTMIAFCLGHLYQGPIAAMLISLYIPFGILTARDKGLGTMMICHVLYDLSTILVIQYIVRTMA